MSDDSERSPAEEFLFWRDEILQVMYWMLGERLAEDSDARQIQVFLGGDQPELERIMDRVAAEGFLERRAHGRYALTELGKDAGKRSFALEFEGLLGQAHGECGPDCWCHKSAARAAQCATERLVKLYAG